MAIDVTVLAYCAGVIDSDGCIGVKRNTYSMRKVGDATQPTYSERVSIKQVEPQAVRLLKDTFGGNLHAPRSRQQTQRKGGRCIR